MDFVDSLLSLPVLSVRQPWASYIVSGLKSVELRTWTTQYRGWLWIHAGKKPDPIAMDLLNLRSDEFRYGGLVGLARLEECHSIESERKWLELRNEHLSPGFFNGQCYGWQFSDALSLSEPIECLGELGLFRLSRANYEYVNQQITTSSTNQEFLKYALNSVTTTSWEFLKLY